MNTVLADLGREVRRLAALGLAPVLALVLALGLLAGALPMPVSAAPSGDHCAGPAEAPQQPKRPDCCLGAFCLMHCALPLPPAAPIFAEPTPQPRIFAASPLRLASGRHPLPPLPPPRPSDRA